MIDLYTDATPNGLKISIALEEMGLEYKPHRIYLGGDQLEAEFTKMNPNQKIPVIKDGETIVSESGAILFYLAEKTGKFLPEGLERRTKTIEMLMFQMSGLGPMFGQFLVFAGAWNNEFPIVTERYTKEISRIFGVLDKILAENDFISGDEYTIADIAFLPWIRMCQVHPLGEQLPLKDNKNLSNWYDRVIERPAVQRGLQVPEPFSPEKQFEAFVSATVGLGKLH